MAGSALLPPPVARVLGAGLDAWLPKTEGPAVDFAQPQGEAALLAPDSLHWRVFKNPVSVFIGGVAAVILELAEPRVCAGVWDHSRFRHDPLSRMKHTGHAAMVSVYGPRSAAEALIACVERMHGKVSGVTAGGQAYAASDPELLTWVQATAAFGFATAYSRYVEPLSPDTLDRFCAESEPAWRLYGVTWAPRTARELDALFHAMADRLESSEVLEAFLAIMWTADILPRGLRRLQPLLVRAAVDIVPAWARARLRLKAAGLRPGEDVFVRRIAAAADRIPLKTSPAVKACLRLGLPGDWLYRRRME